MDFLPASVYQSPSRLARGRSLNTIPEDNEEASIGAASDSEGVLSDTTVIGRPVGLDAKYFIAKPQPRKQTVHPSSPQSVFSSPCGDEVNRCSLGRSSYTGSDAGTVFSESCPSLTGSHASTTFVSESGSIASRASRKKFPSILIPRGSWGSLEGGEVKQMVFGMSPSAKIRLSPEALESLSRTIPAADTPPSLGDNSSVRSESPCIHAAHSLPVTPDMRTLEIVSGRSWGGHDLPLEIAIDEHHSILLSPAEAHSANYATPASTEWTRMIGTFPQIPGATPQEMTPVTPDIPRGFSFARSPVDSGVQLPAVALEVLENIARASTPSLLSDASAREEMQEQYGPADQAVHSESQTPLSEYSYTRLSIPSPSGFFSSLKQGARHTWSSPKSRAPSPPPSSTTAENFYNAPWNSVSESKVIETVLHVVDDDNATDGPPTVKQAMFDSALRTPKESEDLYGSGSTDVSIRSAQEPSKAMANDYGHDYEEGLKQAAVASIGRTSHWLAAQNTYLSALRETNPLNDPADYPVTMAACEDDYLRKNSMVSETNTAELFLHKANVASLALQQATSSPNSSPKEPLFLEVYNQFQSKSRRRDAFSQAAARLESIQSARIALPKLHLKTLLNDCTSQSLESSYIRPKYRGPFSQNPRATGVFARTADQERFANLERQQNALSTIMPAVWLVEAQRKVLYNGRLFACRAADQRLTRTSQNKTTKSRPRVLDLGGAATASWAWAVANKYPEAEVFTVQSTQQTELRVSSPVKSKSDKDIPAGPLTPSNHHVISVPHMWQLPFKSNHFDVVSARSMHMYLRSKPVPAVDSIDEWDMTLKECLRVLKPGGVLDFFVMDSAVSNSPTGIASDNINISPSAMVNPTLPNSAVAKDFLKASQNEAVASNFRFELKKRGYDQDGGCSRLMSRLKNGGFSGIKRQWIALPMGRSSETPVHRSMHSRNTSGASILTTSARCMSPASIKSPSREPAYAQHFNADGTFKTKPFRLAPRPISEVSSVSKIVDQYLNVEAVQGPVGSTTDVQDMCALLGELSYEEWIVRVRIESGIDRAKALDGVHELFDTWRSSGKAAWRGVVGWARKPTTSELKRRQQTATSNAMPSYRTPASHSPQLDQPPTPPPKELHHLNNGSTASSRNATPAPVLTIDTSAAYRAYALQMMQEYSHGSGALTRHVSTLSHITRSAVERGDVGTIPMMIVE